MNTFAAPPREEGKAMTTVATTYTVNYLEEVKKIANALEPAKIDKMIELLLGVRKGGGRLFILGVGGSAGNAGHAVNDFRKICGMEAYAPTDNVSELTARVNDDGWDTSFVNWLRGSRLRAGDAVLVFSVGGGNLEKNISGNIVHAVKHAKDVGAKVLGIVGRDGGYTAKAADACVVIPTQSPETITPHAEAWQAVVWHLIVSHPDMKANEMKWESTK
jgi:D-sedoheptulose 7-phosphate isomerase